MDVAKVLRIEVVIGNYLDSITKLSGIRQGFNLLKSSFQAAIRTMVVAGFFMAIRQIGLMIQGTINAVKTLSSTFAELNLMGVKVAASLTGGVGSLGPVFEETQDYARSLSTQVAFTANEIQKGMFLAATAGMDLEASMLLVAESAKIATFWEEDFGKAVEGNIGIMTAFGVKLEEIPKYTNLMSVAINNSVLHLEEFVNAMGYVAPMAVAVFGESKETFIDTSAALMTLGQAGLRGAREGTVLRASIQRLEAPTSRGMELFAKYGVNLYQAGSKARGYADTLNLLQKATAGYGDKIDLLKTKQLKLAIAGETNTEEFRATTQSINELDSSISVLEKGAGDIYEKFLIAGGKVKSFHELLDELINKRVPVDAIAKVFGIKGSQGIMLLMEQIKIFRKFRKELLEADKENVKGKGFLENIYGTFTMTFSKLGLRIRNTLFGIGSVIFDRFAEQAKPAMETILNSLIEILDWAKNNKALLDNFFKGMLASAIRLVDFLSKELPKIVEQITAVFGEKEYKLPIYKIRKETGEIEKEEKIYTPKTIEERISSITESIYSLFKASLSALLTSYQDTFITLGDMLAKGMTIWFLAHLEVFAILGRTIAIGFIEGVKEYFGRRKEEARERMEAHPIKEGFRQVGVGLGAIGGAIVGAGIGAAAGHPIIGTVAGYYGGAKLGGLIAEKIPEVATTITQVTNPLALLNLRFQNTQESVVKELNTFVETQEKANQSLVGGYKRLTADAKRTIAIIEAEGKDTRKK